MPPIYPFTAIVGQERMKRALVLNAVDPRIGGVLIRGERGTAKSTAARAMAALLPEIEVFAESPFNDNPEARNTWSDWVKEQVAQGHEMVRMKRQIPFVNLPVSATEDRVVGTLDIEKAIQEGKRHFEPGVLAAANRGLLYIDEVNLLDDHVVDVMLDSAAMGVNIVEREGISFSHPARFILVGTMNPEEGDLRPQLLDRFALSVEIHGIRDARDRVMIMQRNLKFEADPEKYASPPAPLHKLWRGVPERSDGGVRTDAGARSARATYVCPMDPEVRESNPGACPKCGMALEPAIITPGTRTPSVGLRSGRGHQPEPRRRDATKSGEVTEPDDSRTGSEDWSEAKPAATGVVRPARFERATFSSGG